MKSIILILLCCCFLTASTQNACDDSYKTFLDCIAETTGDPAKGRQLETEFDQDFVSLVGRCYDSGDTGSNSRCILSQQDLDTYIYGEDGPLRGCPLCQKIALGIRNKFFKAEETVRKCLRDKFSLAVVDELQPCIQKQLNDYSFAIPPLPDFDRSTKDFLDVVEKGMSHRVMAYNRLAVCRYRFPGRAQATSSCINNPSGLYKQHCSLVQFCKSRSVQNTCELRFDTVKGAACTCMALKRNEWHEKLDRVRNAVFNTDTAAECSSGIKNAIGIWRQKLEDAMKTCLSSTDSDLPQIPMDKLIDLGCLRVQAIKGSVRHAKRQTLLQFDQLDERVDLLQDDDKKQLTTGFRMIRNLLDALNDRITNFCDTNC